MRADLSAATGDEIRGLSLLQPWASLMAFDEKRVETRSWATSYRGLVAIAASAKWDRESLELAYDDPDFIWAWNRHGVTRLRELPLGAVLCVGRLVDCIRTEYIDLRRAEYAEREEAFGNYAAGRYAWVFAGMRTLPSPVPVKGSLGLYRIPDSTATQIRDAIAA